MGMSLLLVLLVLPALALATPSQPNSTVVAPTFVVNLDLAPADRWKDIVKIYQSSGPLIVDYFSDQLPPEVVKALEKIMGNLDDLLGEYGAEIRGVADAYGIDLGAVVSLNFAYELRKWGGGHPNITDYQPHVCTSIVAQDSQEHIFHGRNMDWNLPENLRNLSVQIDFQRNGKTVYTGATYVGYVGVFTGLKQGVFSVSVNERNVGGSPIVNALDALLSGATAVSHLVRSALERAYTYNDAEIILKNSAITAPVYYIMAGVKANQGVVLSRDRAFTENTWRLPNPTGQPWYLLQTNYDHWLPDPVHDARRTYGDNHMDTLGQARAANLDGIFDVISTWPVMNNFTCQTVMMQPQTGYFRCYIRYFF